MGTERVLWMSSHVREGFRAEDSERAEWLVVYKGKRREGKRGGGECVGKVRSLWKKVGGCGWWCC